MVLRLLPARSRSWGPALRTLEAMREQLLELTDVTFTGPSICERAHVRCSRVSFLLGLLPLKIPCCPLCPLAGLITASAGQVLWNLQEAHSQPRDSGDWRRGTALLAAMAARRLLSKEASAAAAACCAKRWLQALHVLVYFDLHGGEVDGVLAGAVINAMSTGHRWTEAVSLLGTRPVLRVLHFVKTFAGSWYCGNYSTAACACLVYTSACEPRLASSEGARNVLITACGRAMEAVFSMNFDFRMALGKLLLPLPDTLLVRCPRHRLFFTKC